jgi:serine/threonine protein kinase
MGTVYLARRCDGRFERQVALKLMHGSSTDAEALRRSRSERQILARLEHPSIARLYDAGETEHGLPFLIMEYVEGWPLDVYCDAQRLRVDGRLRLCRPLFDAVAYAHRNLLVHGDIKPSNVLVNTAGEIKLLDFGTAKRLAEAGGAEPDTAGARAMTLAFASPEQVRGEPVTTASDVYALGVLLYELLCGCCPYRLEGCLASDLEDAILHQQPDPPSRSRGRPVRGEGLVASAEDRHILTARRTGERELYRALRGDLDAIVLRALHKDPRGRYESVAALADDVERHLRLLPVSARPDTVTYRAGRFVRRRRVGLAAAASTLGLMFVLVTNLFRQRQRAARARQNAPGLHRFA